MLKSSAGGTLSTRVGVAPSVGVPLMPEGQAHTALPPEPPLPPPDVVVTPPSVVVAPPVPPVVLAPTLVLVVPLPAVVLPRVADEVFAVVPTLLAALVVDPAEVPLTAAVVVVVAVVFVVVLPESSFAESSDPEQATGVANAANTSSFAPV